MQLKKFYYPKEYDYEKMAGIVGLLRGSLDGYAKGTLPSDSYGDAQLKVLLQSLVTGQRTEESLAGSWAVCPRREDLPEDEVMDFVQFPTCEAAALLSWSALKKPELLAEAEGWEEALSRGFQFLADQDIQGYGADGVLQTMEALLILCAGQVPRYLQAHPEASPALAVLLGRYKEELRRKLDQGEMTTPWGQDLAPLAGILIKAL